MDTLDLVGYSDRLSAVAGETIVFHVSSRSAEPFDARLLRVIHADPNPAGPGLRFADLGDRFATRATSIDQPIRRGSWARVDRMPWPAVDRDWSVCARILPTAPGRQARCVMSQWSASARCGWYLTIDVDGATVTLADGVHAPIERRLATPIGVRWADISFAYRAGTRTLSLSYAPIDTRHPPAETSGRLDDEAFTAWAVAPPSLGIAALDASAPSQHFNGCIEAPRIESADMVVGAWDFARGIDTPDVIDVGPAARHGRIVNLPTRAVRSSTWSGREGCWRAAPDEYAAIHFHDDDLDDAGWSPSFAFTVPDDLPSGSYAMALTATTGAGEAREWLPFWVSARVGRPSAPIVFVVPTYTYQAYANFARGNFDAALQRRMREWGAYPHNPDAHPEVGLSTYNVHSDGSGVSFSSRLRPMLTMRPGFLTFDDPRGSGCRHYIADHHLLDWLEHEGFAFDVVTDDDLERHGAAILAPYRAVLTGTHPEYHTARTLDAFDGYLRQGGHLAYLGGNGFYWRVAVSDRFPGALEMRRGDSGTRAWASAPGERHNALDGNLGGLWRDSGRPPQHLVGIGFTSQGPFEGSTFRVHDEARDQPGGWLLDGVASGSIGGYGLSGGGAAGFELDSTSVADGSPAHYTLLATSEGHGPGFGPALDASLTHTTSRDRRPVASLIKAEMIHYDTGWGGSVFSVGSITWCGSLSHDGYRNDVATVMHNYVSRVAGAPSGALGTRVDEPADFLA